LAGLTNVGNFLETGIGAGFDRRERASKIGNVNDSAASCIRLSPSGTARQVSFLLLARPDFLGSS
jgi:hypothetical protein